MKFTRTVGAISAVTALALSGCATSTQGFQMRQGSLPGGFFTLSKMILLTTPFLRNSGLISSSICRSFTPRVSGGTWPTSAPLT